MAERMSNREQERAFFSSKKPWSVQKDQILSRYLAAYLKKILFRRYSVTKPDQPVLIVDAFAGMGWFEDGNPGSPVHIIEAADAVAQGRYILTLGNHDPEQHERLKAALAPYDHARPYLWDSRRMLRTVAEVVGDRALFVFIDPFGITGYEFGLIAPLIGRVNDGLSTELLINFAVPHFHRMSARDSVIEHGIENLDENTKSKIANLDSVLGGRWWREFQYDPGLDTEEREALLIEGYVRKLKEAGFEYVGHCPIREQSGDSPVYRLIHGSRHIEALKIMNETMGNVIAEQFTNEVESAAPLFASDLEFLEWERERALAAQDLSAVVPEHLRIVGEGSTREALWESIVVGYFLQFRKVEYRAAVKRLVAAGVFRFERADGKPQLNDDAKLYFA